MNSPIIEGGTYSFFHNGTTVTGTVTGTLNDNPHQEVYMETEYTDENGKPAKKWYIIPKTLLFMPINNIVN